MEVGAFVLVPVTTEEATATFTAASSPDWSRGWRATSVLDEAYKKKHREKQSKTNERRAATNGENEEVATQSEKKGERNG